MVGFFVKAYKSIGYSMFLGISNYRRDFQDDV